MEKKFRNVELKNNVWLLDLEKGTRWKFYGIGKIGEKTVDILSKNGYNENTKQTQVSPSGMAAASQAVPGEFDSRHLLHMNPLTSSEQSRVGTRKGVLFLSLITKGIGPVMIYARELDSENQKQ